MRIFLYPGSFDPPTKGHEDIARRAAKLCDKLIVAVFGNVNKLGAMFSIQERVDMLREVFRDAENIEVRYFDGLVADACKREHVSCIVRGVRTQADMENEMQLASINQNIGCIDTIFFPANASYMYVSSTAVRELVHYNHDISSFVPDVVRNTIENAD